MSKETVGYVQLEWNCPRCGAKNPGMQKTCQQCGGPMPEDTAFSLPAEQVLITDETQLERAKRGPDVLCPYCGAPNPAGTEACTQCGGKLAEGKARTQGQVLGAHTTGPAADVPCPFCGTPNPAGAATCKQCGGVLKATPQPVAAAPTAAAPAGPSRTMMFAIAGVVALLALCACVFIVLSLRTTDVNAVVQSTQWERSIAILEQRPVQHEDWIDQIPNDAVRGTCSDKVRRTESNPVAGAERVCGTPYVVDQGSGAGQVVQDCEYRVHDQWCEYTVQEWTAVDAVVAKGTDLNPVWPAFNARTGQREGDHTEKYEVVFATENQRYTYNPSATDYPRFTTGSRWALKVNGLGAITSVAPAR
jgi:ribosomal protein L40E